MFSGFTHTVACQSSSRCQHTLGVCCLGPPHYLIPQSVYGRLVLLTLLKRTAQSICVDTDLPFVPGSLSICLF